MGCRYFDLQRAQMEGVGHGTASSKRLRISVQEITISNQMGNKYVANRRGKQNLIYREAV